MPKYLSGIQPLEKRQPGIFLDMPIPGLLYSSLLHVDFCMASDTVNIFDLYNFLQRPLKQKG